MRSDAMRNRWTLRVELACDRRKRQQWARAHGFTTNLVTLVLNRKLLGRWGEAHRAAVLLGLKEARVKAKPAGALRSPDHIRRELYQAREQLIGYARARGFKATVVFAPVERRRYKLAEVSIRQFARQHDFSVGLVSDVVNGKLPTNRGKSREVAILLGIKQGEIQL